MKDIQLSYLYEEFKNLFKKITGCTPSDNKKIVLKRIQRFMDKRKLSLSDLSLLENRIKQNNEFADKFFEIFIPRESYFFREKEYLTLITETLIPKIKKQPINILSAPCSGGEEVYSLKILLKEKNSHNQTVIKGIDISKSAIETAKKKKYGKNSLKSLPVSIKSKYFLKTEEDRFSLKSELADNTEFQRENIMNIREKEVYDIILCRNFLIYFDRDTRERVLKKLHGALKENGFLIVGETELSLIKNKVLFKKCVKNKLVFYQKVGYGKTADC